MKYHQERNLVLRIIEFALSNEQVTLNSLYRNLNLQGDEADYLRTYLINWRNETAPNHILTIPFMYQNGQVMPDTNLQLLPNAVFSYIDHLEIVQAREAAKEARKLSWVAIWISICIGLFSLGISTLQLYLQVNN